jgi:hypothetical protein
MRAYFCSSKYCHIITQTTYDEPTLEANYFIIICFAPVLIQAKILPHDWGFRRKRAEQRKLASSYHQLIN